MRTPLCELLGIEFPIIQAGMSLFTSAELVCAASNADGLGSLDCWWRPPEDLAQQLAVIRERTSRPFAINHVVPALDETVFATTISCRRPRRYPPCCFPHYSLPERRQFIEQIGRDIPFRRDRVQ